MEDKKIEKDIRTVINTYISHIVKITKGDIIEILPTDIPRQFALKISYLFKTELAERDEKIKDLELELGKAKRNRVDE